MCGKCAWRDRYGMMVTLMMTVVDIRPAKVIAGLECDVTNAFLVKLSRAARLGKAVSDDAVTKTCISMNLVVPTFTSPPPPNTETTIKDEQPKQQQPAIELQATKKPAAKPVESTTTTPTSKTAAVKPAEQSPQAAKKTVAASKPSEASSKSSSAKTAVAKPAAETTKKPAAGSSSVAPKPTVKPTTETTTKTPKPASSKPAEQPAQNNNKKVEPKPTKTPTVETTVVEQQPEQPQSQPTASKRPSKPMVAKPNDPVVKDVAPEVQTRVEVAPRQLVRPMTAGRAPPKQPESEPKIFNVNSGVAVNVLTQDADDVDDEVVVDVKQADVLILVSNGSICQ